MTSKTWGPDLKHNGTPGFQRVVYGVGLRLVGQLGFYGVVGPCLAEGLGRGPPPGVRREARRASPVMTEIKDHVATSSTSAPAERTVGTGYAVKAYGPVGTDSAPRHRPAAPQEPSPEPQVYDVSGRSRVYGQHAITVVLSYI